MHHDLTTSAKASCAGPSPRWSRGHRRERLGDPRTRARLHLLHPARGPAAAAAPPAHAQFGRSASCCCSTAGSNPRRVCWAIEHVVVTGVVGQVDGPAARDVRVDAVIDLPRRRTVACRRHRRRRPATTTAPWRRSPSGRSTSPTPWCCVGPMQTRRLAAGPARTPSWPGSHRGAPSSGDGDAPDVERLLLDVPAGARRGELSDAHSPLLRGQPPLPRRLRRHARRVHRQPAVPPGTAARGDRRPARRCRRLSRPRVGGDPTGRSALARVGGRWPAGGQCRPLAGRDDAGANRSSVPTERRAMAALCWDERFGDRHTSMVVLVHAADPTEIDRTLQWALSPTTNSPTRRPWPPWHDPFGEFHEDPCDEQRITLRRNRIDREGTRMKTHIHPDYHPVVFQDASTGKTLPHPVDGDQRPHRPMGRRQHLSAGGRGRDAATRTRSGPARSA